MRAWLRTGVIWTILASGAGLAAVPSVARAAWGSEPVTIHATSSYVGSIQACTDGAGGSLVLWSEENDPAGTGVLRAQHLLENGDLDPSWSASGVVVHSFGTLPSEWRVLPDRLGGFYLWWLTQSNALMLKRLNASGQTASGWPASGRVLGSVFGSIPCVIEDGAHGLYVAFSGGTQALGYHLGPDNTGAGGWSNTWQVLGSAGLTNCIVLFPQVTMAPDGGMFAAWGTWCQDTVAAPPAYSVHRLTSAGATASGWTDAGVSLGYFPFDELFNSSYTLGTSILGLSSDGRGGVFVVAGESVDGADLDPMRERLYRLQGDGQGAADWPMGGLAVSTDGLMYYVGGGSESDLRVLPDGQDGALAGSWTPLGPDSPGYSRYQQYNSAGVGGDWWMGILGGHEVAQRPEGGAYFGYFYPDSKFFNSWEPDAMISLSAVPRPSSSWSGLSEVYSASRVLYYGDIGLTATDDGGCVFFWSQRYERYGLFARRFSSLGEVTGVEPASMPTTLVLSRLRWVRGTGIRASLSLPGDGPARLEVFDVTGRRLAGERLDGVRGTVDRTFAGTASLRSGIYFVRLATEAGAVRGRVVVLD